MMSSDLQKIQYISEYCIAIGKTIQRFGNTFDAYIADPDYQRSVCFSILQIGELSGSLSEEYRQENTDRIQWWSIKAMRNLVAHSYCRLDQSMMIWITATVDIPALLQFCEDELSLG